jgi:nitrate reductase gamma subunit
MVAKASAKIVHLESTMMAKKVHVLIAPTSPASMLFTRLVRAGQTALVLLLALQMCLILQAIQRA